MYLELSNIENCAKDQKQVLYPRVPYMFGQQVNLQAA